MILACWIEYLADQRCMCTKSVWSRKSSSFMEVRPARRCSSCGQQGHNARTCLEKDERVGCARPVDITFHEAPSPDAYEQQGSADGSSFLQGLAPRLLGVANHSLSGSESEAQNASQLPHISRERRRGTPWTEEEHRAFLAGLEKLGKGDWRGISKDYVTTRTPTQVASHAQKYFIRHNNQSKRKRRTSLFDLKADAEVLEMGSAEATSATWPAKVIQRSSSASHGVHNVHTHQQAGEQLDRNAAASQSSAFPGMWHPQGADMVLMQQYMQMAASHMDPAAMHMAQMAQLAAAQGLNFPPFGIFPPPGMAEQVMAAYGAGFPPFSQDAMALAQQQAALAAAIYTQQHQQSQQPPEVLQQAAAAACALNQACQSAAPPPPVLDHRPDHHSDSTSSGEQQQQQHQQGGMHRQHQAEKPAESSCADRQQSMPLLSARAPVKDDPEFGHGKLYKPQASHAKASVPPPSTKFGGAMTDNLSASTLSRKSSSESAVPTVSHALKEPAGQTLPGRLDLATSGKAADGATRCQL